MAAEMSWHPQCPKTISNSYECAQYLEKIAFDKYAKFAFRKDGTLFITLTTGAQTKFNDKNTSPNEMVGYNLVEVYPDIGYALIHEQYWEGGTYDLVNLQSGQIEEIKGWPLISPSKKYLVSINFGGVSGYTDSVIKIYRLARPHLILDWSLMPPWAPSDPHWITDSKLELLKNTFSPELCERLHKTGKYVTDLDCYIKEKAIITLKDGKWQLQ
jgi:hypothetical protein